MQNIKKLKAQIKALNNRIEQRKVKNVYPVQNKIKSLQMALKIELEQQYWRNLESI